jgi:hypothetical protein
MTQPALSNKILKGDPAAPPVEQPIRFEAVFDLSVAKALGISFPYWACADPRAARCATPAVPA